MLPAPVGAGQPGPPALLWPQTCFPERGSAAAHCLRTSQCVSLLATHPAKAVLVSPGDVLTGLLANVRVRLTLSPLV